MSDQCSVAVYASFKNAEVGLRALHDAGFPEQQVSLVTHDVAQEVLEAHVLQYGDKSVEHMAKGAGAGGLLGALLASPLLVVPGIGPAVFAGPLAAAATGAIVGGFLGGMMGWGVHPDRVRQYEAKVKEGCILVVANGDPAEVAMAHRILQNTNVAETHLHARTSEDASEVDDRPGNVLSRS